MHDYTGPYNDPVYSSRKIETRNSTIMSLFFIIWTFGDQKDQAYDYTAILLIS